MHLIGRWARVREFGQHGWGAGYLYDRKFQTLLPNKDRGEWWQAKSGLWHRVGDAFGNEIGGFRGGLDWGGMVIGHYAEDTNNFTTQNLNSAYTYNSAGQSYAMRVVLPATKTLTDVYFYISSYTGTAANVNDINVEVRNDSPNKPGSTQHAVQTVDPASATGWIKVTGFSQSLTAGTVYWIVVADPDGGAVDFAVCTRQYQLSSGWDEQIVAGPNYLALSTSNGWTSPSLAIGVACICLVFNDGSVMGNPYVTSSVAPTNTRQRGIRIENTVLNADIKVWGAKMGNTVGNLTSMNFWEDGAGPGGSPTYQATVLYITGRSNVSTNIIGAMFGTPITLSALTDYRVVGAFSSNNFNPTRLSIGTGSDANIRGCMLAGGKIYHTDETAGAAWNDDTTLLPALAVLVDDLVTPAGGSGGGLKLAGRGGLAG